VSSIEGDLAALETLKQENEALKAQLEELNQQCESFKTQSVRIAADFDNFRKRTTKEKEDLEQQVKRVTLTELLPVVDNFERARSQLKPQSDGEMTIHKSYQGVYKQLVDCLKRIGVSPMRPEGKEFDPNLHEAVMREPSNEYPEGVVIEQLMRGYFLGDRVLRHAMVNVASAPENPGEDAGENPESASE
jgi:molecular chaperone GrpE